jgi:Predicted nucleic acid-binding protein, contains PIN domain
MGPEKILADTCIWIEYFRGKSPFSEELRRLIQKGVLVITGPVVFELLQGAKNKKDADLIKEVTRGLPLIEVTHEIWLSAGDLYFDLRRKGITIPPSDVLLAAIAIDNNWSLFTTDNHFDHIPKLRRHSIPKK